MVLAERSNDAVRNGKRSRGPSPNGHGTHPGYSSSSEDENAEKIRVGRDYQAVCPELEAPDQRKPELLADRALLVWSPTIDISDSKLDEYITIAKEKYGYNGEQALGMLFWHKHDLNRASLDLANFTPFPDEWTVEDKVLFEQAFQFHGKSFHRIRQMLPDKSIASLVKYYYSWKKTRARTSLMDRGGPGSGGGSGSKRESDAGSDAGGSDKEISDTDKKENGGEGGKWCSVCGILCSTVMQHNSHKLCQACYAHARRTGNMRAVCGGPRRSGGPHKQRYKHRLPRGIYLNHDDLVAIATAAAAAQTSNQPPPSHTHGDSILNAMDREIVSLKRQVQHNKQQLSAMKRKCEGVEELRPGAGEPPAKINARWTNDELLMAVTAVRKYGTDFQAIAETIGTKTEAHVRTFFISYRRRYNLDAVIKEHEAERATLSAQPQTQPQPQPGSASTESEPASGGANGPKPETDATVSSKDEKPELDSEGVALGSEGEQGGVPTTPPKIKHK